MSLGVLLYVGPQGVEPGVVQGVGYGVVQGVGYGLVQGVFVGVLEVVDGLLDVSLEKRDGSSLSHDVEILACVVVCIGAAVYIKGASTKYRNPMLYMP